MSLRTRPIYIGIIEDDPQFADNLSLILRQDERVQVCFISASIEEAALRQKTALAQCNCILLDINLEGMNGICGIPFLQKNIPADCQIIMLTLHEGSDAIRDAFRQGASGYLLKADPLATLQAQIYSSVQLGVPAISRPVINHLVSGSLPSSDNSLKLEKLTEREKVIYSFLLKGFDYKRIAAELHISGATVNFHLKNIFIKMNVHTRAELLSKHLEMVEQNRAV